MASLNKLETLSLAEVRTRMLSMLADSGLDERDAKAMKCEPLTAAQCAQRNVSQFPGAGFTIPYFNTAGRVTKFYRFRYVEDVGANGLAGLTRRKQLRYVQPAGILPTVYWAPLAPWSKIVESAEPLYITEGEKKAACATKNGFATLGLGGVWSFKSKDKNVSLIDELQAIDWKDRRVYIVYDSDAVSNRNVIMAETELARQLLERGALVLTVRLPDKEDGGKMGMDDFLVASGRDAFQKLVDEEAEEFVNSRALHDLNQRCTVLLNPPVIWDNENRRFIPYDKFTALTHAHLKFTVIEHTTGKDGEPKVKMTEKRTAQEWVRWPGRSVADSLAFVPGGNEYVINERGKRAINAWESWGCEPKKGDIKPWRTLFEFITQGNDPEWTRWFEQWLAYPLQHPGFKMYSAVVVWSIHQGTGKSFIAHIMSKIYGEQNFSEIGVDDIYSNFNSWAVNKQFILGEEIAGAENKRALSDRLKKMITQPYILVNTKYIPQYKVKDCGNFYFTSNHPDAFYLEDTDRRFFVQEVRNPPMSLEVYQQIDAWAKGDGPAALFHHLLQVDVSDFNPKGNPPLTRAKQDMRHESKSEVGRWVADLKMEEGRMIVAGKPMEFSLVTTNDLYAIFDPEKRKGLMTQLSKELRRAGIPRAHNGEPVKIGPATHRLWIVANVEKMLKASPKLLVETYIKEHGDGIRKF